MTTTKTPPDHFPDATKMIAALEDDVKPIRDALSEFNRRFTSANSVDVGPRVSVPTAEWRDLRTRLLAHIDAQALRLEAAERRAAVLEIEAEALRTWKADVIEAAEKAHGPHAIRFKLSLRKNCTATNTFPKWLDQRWVSFVYAEDDAHIGYIAKAIDAHIAAIASEAGK